MNSSDGLAGYILFVLGTGIAGNLEPAASVVRLTGEPLSVPVVYTSDVLTHFCGSIRAHGIGAFGYVSSGTFCLESNRLAYLFVLVKKGTLS